MLGQILQVFHSSHCQGSYVKKFNTFHIIFHHKFDHIFGCLCNASTDIKEACRSREGLHWACGLAFSYPTMTQEPLSMSVVVSPCLLSTFPSSWLRAKACLPGHLQMAVGTRTCILVPSHCIAGCDHRSFSQCRTLVKTIDLTVTCPVGPMPWHCSTGMSVSNHRSSGRVSVFYPFKGCSLN